MMSTASSGFTRPSVAEEVTLWLRGCGAANRWRKKGRAGTTGQVEMRAECAQISGATYSGCMVNDVLVVCLTRVQVYLRLIAAR